MKDKVKQGRRNRINGADLERKVVNVAKEHHLDAQRIHGTGLHAKGHDDVVIKSVLYGDVSVECKYRQKIALLYDIIGENRIGVVQAARKEPLAVVPLKMFMELLQ